MIELIWAIIHIILAPVVLLAAPILFVIDLLLPYIVAVVGAALVIAFTGAAIYGLIFGSIRQKLKIIALITGLAAMFATPYFIHNRGWDAVAALGVLLAAFTYNQVREL